MLDKLLQWDRDCFVYLNTLGIEELDIFWTTATQFYSWIPLYFLFIFLFLKKFSKKEALYMILVVLLTLGFVAVFTELTKELIGRIRPNNDTEFNMAIRVLKNPVSYSFFSGHASSSFSVTTLVVLFLRKHFKWTYLFYIWPILFATSRIFVGVHFPLDIIVGLLVGILSAILFYKVYTRLIIPYLGLTRP